MINLDMTERFLKQQTDCLDILTELIAFDKEHGEPTENTRVLEAFIDTQRRALDLAGKLLEKHKPALEEAAKAEREKREAESKIKAAEAKEAQKKEQAKKDLEKAKTDENSLFCDFADEEADPKADELTEDDEGYAILVDEEFSYLEFDMNRDTISWIRRKIEYRRSLMEHLPKKTIENGIGYTLVGDYYIPDLQLPRKAVPLEFGAVCTKPIWSYTTQPGITT